LSLPKFRRFTVAQGIQDKIIVITGASSGLGEAAARPLSSQGAVVVLGARRLDRIQALAAARHWRSKRTSPTPGR
jgi:NADP-dependent 3-hydroxy acid dehydrogenase YdfG